MKPLARNAFSYCKAVINAGLLLGAESSTPIFLSDTPTPSLKLNPAPRLKVLIVYWSETF